MFSFTTSSSSAPTTTGAKSLLARVTTLARAEARAAQERRGLPFSGMFCSDEILARPAAPAPRA